MRVAEPFCPGYPEITFHVAGDHGDLGGLGELDVFRAFLHKRRAGRVGQAFSLTAPRSGRLAELAKAVS